MYLMEIFLTSWYWHRSYSLGHWSECEVSRWVAVFGNVCLYSYLHLSLLWKIWRLIQTSACQPRPGIRAKKNGGAGSHSVDSYSQPYDGKSSTMDTILGSALPVRTSCHIRLLAIFFILAATHLQTLFPHNRRGTRPAEIWPVQVIRCFATSELITNLTTLSGSRR